MLDAICRKHTPVIHARGGLVPIPGRRREINGRTKKNQRGAVLVETALTLLTVIMLILGGMDLGQVLMQLQYFENRARATARWASTHTTDPTIIKNYGAFGTPTPAPGVTTGSFGLSPAHITVATPGAGTPSYRIEVSITKPLQFFTPFLRGSFTPRPARSIVPVESAGESATI